MAPYPSSYSESAYDAWWESVTAQRRDLGDISPLQFFFARSAQTFLTEDTSPEAFHAPDGDMETDFMHQRESQIYYWGDRFAAVKQSFELGGDMWFLLPDENVTPEQLLADKETMNFLFVADRAKWEKRERLFVNKSIPKFDVSSQFELIDGLQALGVTDVFDPEVSDFTPMTTGVDEGIYVSQANHAARVVIDEEGCTAAAFTVMRVDGAASAPSGEVDFVLSRPFVFCITGESGLPLFVGIVNYPAGE